MRGKAPKEQMATPVLSICIPTYQRKEALKATLDKLVETAQGCPACFEICISDNASADNTLVLLQSYANKHPFIRFRHNNTNTGFDRNVSAALKMARGRYCWIIGDDDTVIPRGVISLVQALKGGNDFVAGFIAAGRPEHIADVDRIFPKSDYSVQEFIDVNLSSQNKKTREGLLVYGFLPCYLFSRKALAGDYDLFNSTYTGWQHLSLFFHVVAMHPEGRILVHHDPPIKYSTEEDFATVCLPDKDIQLYTADRLKAITLSPVHSRLEEPAKHWLRLHSGYWYMVNILRLMFMRRMLKPSYYRELRGRVYAFGDKMELPPRYLLITRFLKVVERIPIAREWLAGAYAVRSRYAGRFLKYTLPKLRAQNLLAEPGRP